LSENDVRRSSPLPSAFITKSAQRPRGSSPVEANATLEPSAETLAKSLLLWGRVRRVAPWPLALITQISSPNGELIEVKTI